MASTTRAGTVFAELPPPARQVDVPKSKHEAPILRPTMEEFANFEEFVRRARVTYPQYGLVKVVPPAEWKARKSGSYTDIDQLKIPLPIKQVLQGSQGVYTQYNIEQKPLTVEEFKGLAEKKAQESRLTKIPLEGRERAYWKTLAFNPSLYGADMPGTLFDADLETWNLSKLPSLLRLLDQKMQGINEPYIYFGMWKAAFAWHVEDMELYSINYLHYGEPKLWYGIPTSQSTRFEGAAQFLFPTAFRECKQFLRHKQTIISPSILNGFNLTLHTVVQQPGEFVITWPGAYHSGYNLGYNCAEAVNFAMEDWLPIGRDSLPCLCDSDRAVINMDYFTYKYEMEKYGKPVTNPEWDVEAFLQQGPWTTPKPKSSKKSSSSTETSPRKKNEPKKALVKSKSNTNSQVENTQKRRGRPSTRKVEPPAGELANRPKRAATSEPAHRRPLKRSKLTEYTSLNLSGPLETEAI